MLGFLDLDDVLNEFTMHALKWYDIDVKYEDIVTRDIVKTAQDHGWEHDAVTFWRYLPQSVWSRCPRSKLFDVISGDYILTAPTTNPSCAAGKIEWLNNNWKKGHIITEHKWLLSKPGRVLVDDSESNIKSWERAGGTGILVPRPWNKNRDKDMVEYTMDKLNDLRL